MRNKSGEIFTKNYYSVLDLSPGASIEEIDAAYIKAKNLFEGKSDVLYSLYTPEEREHMLSEITEAYEALSDPARPRGGDEGPAPQQEEITETSEVDVGSLIDLNSRARRIEAKNVCKLSEPLPSARDAVAAEQYKILNAKLNDLSRRGLKAFAVTSAVKGEGKSVTSLNLAYLMATEFKKKTVLVECDLRKPSSLARYVNTIGSKGLSDIISGSGATIEQSISRVEDTLLHILPAGETREHSALLEPGPLKEIFTLLKKDFDFVIVDSPPVLQLVDMNIISRLVDGVLMVVMAGKTPRDLVSKAVNSLKGSNMVGFVLNGTEAKKARYYHY